MALQVKRVTLNPEQIRRLKELEESLPLAEAELERAARANIDVSEQRSNFERLKMQVAGILRVYGDGK